MKELKWMILFWSSWEMKFDQGKMIRMLKSVVIYEFISKIGMITVISENGKSILNNSCMCQVF